ncbi:MAG TPA: hypothetical protein VLM38_20620 [Blastocatellia bacterium]|nr:hypothetical protein [Blastocatellia bacterium]
MKTPIPKIISSIAMCSLIIASLGQSGLSQQAVPAKETTPKKAAPTRKAKPAESPAAPGWLSINIVRVKADMLAEYQDFAKNETIPALQKGGVKQREAWGTGVFGEAFEFVYVTPIDSFAQYDSPGPIVKALGEEGARAYGAKARRLIVSSHTYAVQTRPDLSLMGNMSTPKLAVINSIRVVPGKGPAFESLLKTDILPAVKKAGATNYFVSQTVFGGDPNEYVTVTPMDSFAEIGKGSPVVRGMGGQAAFNRWLAKVSGIIASQERTVGRYLPDLSFPTPAKAENK